MKRTKSKFWDADTYIASWRDAAIVIETMIKPYILSSIDIPDGGTVLECGIGSGKWSAGFALLGYRVYAMDNSDEILKQSYVNFTNIRMVYIEHDIRTPPLVHDQVDLIFNEGVIEHFLDDEERKHVLTNFYDAVKGYVSIIVPYKSEEEDEIYYTKKKLKEELGEVGFHIVDEYCLEFISGDGKTIRRMIGVNAKK